MCSENRITNNMKNNLVRQITSEFMQLENVFSNIRNMIDDLTSVHRRCEKASSTGSIEYTSDDPSDIVNYVDVSLLRRVQSSFQMTVAEANENLAEEVSRLVDKTSKLIALLESLNEILQTVCSSQLERFFAFTQVFQALDRMRSCLIDEIDLTLYWAYSHISPTLVPAVSDAFLFSSSCISEQSMACTVWRDEISPLLHRHVL